MYAGWMYAGWMHPGCIEPMFAGCFFALGTPIYGYTQMLELLTEFPKNGWRLNRHNASASEV